MFTFSFVSDACSPLVYRVLDDHRRSILYRASDSSTTDTSNKYNVIKDTPDLDEDYLLYENSISIVRNQQELLCDDVLPSGWYRFLTYGMSRDMATSCPGPGSCGTVAPVWLDMSTLQNLTSNTFYGEACVSWGFGDGGFDNYDCCLFTLPVQIKQCNGFRVYFLGPTQACDIAYCSAPSIKAASKTGKKYFWIFSAFKHNYFKNKSVFLTFLNFAA